MCARIICLTVFFIQFVWPMSVDVLGDDLPARRQYLQQLLSVLPPEKPQRGQVSPLDATWQDWLKRTGELPPDFDAKVARCPHCGRGHKVS